MKKLFRIGIQKLYKILNQGYADLVGDLVNQAIWEWTGERYF